MYKKIIGHKCCVCKTTLDNKTYFVRRREVQFSASNWDPIIYQQVKLSQNYQVPFSKEKSYIFYISALWNTPDLEVTAYMFMDIQTLRDMKNVQKNT